MSPGLSNHRLGLPDIYPTAFVSIGRHHLKKMGLYEIYRDLMGFYSDLVGFYSWLVVEPATPLKNDGVKVSWDDVAIPNIWKIKFMFQTTTLSHFAMRVALNDATRLGCGHIPREVKTAGGNTGCLQAKGRESSSFDCLLNVTPEHPNIHLSTAAIL